MVDIPLSDFRKMAIEEFDTTKLLKHAAQQATERGYAKFPVWANGRRGGSIRVGTPRLGEHSREILVELGFDDGEIAELRKNSVVL